MITIMYSNYAPSPGHIGRLEHLVGPGRVDVAHNERTALVLSPKTEIILGHRYLRQVMPLAVNLRWVQSSAAGFEHLPTAELAARGITLTRNTTHSKTIAHHAIALAWSLLRRLPSTSNNRELYASRPAYVAMPALPRNALVLGLGEIGSSVAKLLRGMGLYVRGAARTDTASKQQACDELLVGDRWRKTLSDTDLVVLALPLNDETRHCLGKDEILSLPPHALVVNIGRTELVDLDCLIDALNKGLLRGAALDALAPALSTDDRCWNTPNLLITPKIAAFHPNMQAEFERFTEVQVARYLNGKPLAELVDLNAGTSST